MDIEQTTQLQASTTVNNTQVATYNANISSDGRLSVVLNVTAPALYAVKDNQTQVQTDFASFVSQAEQQALATYTSTQTNK